MKRQRGLRSHYPSTRNPQPPTAPGSTAGSFSGETPPDPQPQGPALVTTVPPEETQRMSPIAASASRPVSVCPVPAHLRPTIIYSGRRKRFTASRNPGLLRLMSGAYLCPAPGRQRWEQRFMVSLARAIAAQQLLPSATCLSHTSAALVQGLAMWTREPDVYLAVSGHPRLTTTTLPAFRYPASGVPVPTESAPSETNPIRLHRRQLQLRDEEIEVVGGVPVTSVLRTAFDCACDEPPHNALSIADAALNRHCRLIHGTATPAPHGCARLTPAGTRSSHAIGGGEE